jgi:hypothetical protein
LGVECRAAFKRRRYFSSGSYPQLHTIAKRDKQSLMGREKKCPGILEVFRI